jgi:hypothetical protein
MTAQQHREHLANRIEAMTSAIWAFHPDQHAQDVTRLRLGRFVAQHAPRITAALRSTTKGTQGGKTRG